MILFDTNILVYSQNKDDPRYENCRDWIAKSETGELNGVVSAQNLAETAAVLLNLAKIAHKTNDLKLDKVISGFSGGMFKIVYPNLQTIALFSKYLSKHTSTPRKIFDIFLYATMVSNRVTDILTYNGKDFAGFNEINVVAL